MKRVLVALLLCLPILASAQHRVYKAGNRVMISGQGMNNSAPSENVNIYRVNDRIRVDYGTSGIWLNANTFLDATGKPWGNTIDRAIFNYFEEANSVTVSNLSTDTVNVRLANRQAIQTVIGDVNVKNLPSTQPVSVTNWPTTQTVNGSVNANVTFPTTQQVGGVVNVGNFPTNQNVTIQNPVTSLAVSNFPAKQAIEGGNTNAVNIAGAVTANVTFPATQNVNVVNPVTTVTANVQGGNATAVKVDGSAVTQPVSGVFWPATQPVSGAVSISGPVTIQDTYQILPADTWQYSNASLAALSTVQIAPAVAGRRHYITGLQIYNLATLVLGTIEVLDGATVIARVQIPAAGGKEVVFPTPLRGSVNSAISVRPATASVALMVSAQGYLSNN